MAPASRICPEPRCFELVAAGGRCREHRVRRQPHESHRIYGTAAWRRLRLIVLAEEPWCRMCVAEGRTTHATDVDHIVPMSLGGAPLDRANLRGLCHSCHSRVTARSVPRWGRGR